MPFVVGFLIATAVGLTGVGAGTITAPVLILFFGISPAAAVGTALTFAAVIKAVVAPAYLLRRQVSLPVLLRLCAGGIPGVLGGVWLVHSLSAKNFQSGLMLIVGATIAITALFTLYRVLRPIALHHGRDGARWLPIIAVGIGTEVGFSSAGAGALGSLALLNLTKLSPAQVVGTDMIFGLVLALLGGGLHLAAGHYDSALLTRLLVGGVVGVWTGANLSSIVPPRPLRIALAVSLTAIGLQLCWRSF
jgi:uncharacterized membrane protein YfcA